MTDRWSIVIHDDYPCVVDAEAVSPYINLRGSVAGLVIARADAMDLPLLRDLVEAANAHRLSQTAQRPEQRGEAPHA